MTIELKKDVDSWALGPSDSSCYVLLRLFLECVECVPPLIRTASIWYSEIILR